MKARSALNLLGQVLSLVLTELVILVGLVAALAWAAWYNWPALARMGIFLIGFILFALPVTLAAQLPFRRPGWLDSVIAHGQPVSATLVSNPYLSAEWQLRPDGWIVEVPVRLESGLTSQLTCTLDEARRLPENQPIQVCLDLAHPERSALPPHQALSKNTLAMHLIEPRLLPPLDPSFRPAVLANRHFQTAVQNAGVRAVLGLQRSDDEISHHEIWVYPEGHPNFAENFDYVERIVKFLLWQRGGHTLFIGGPPPIAEAIRQVYSASGARQFDVKFLGEQVYEKEFSVVSCSTDEVPPAHELGKSLGRHLDGCRIGFDLGASDRKVSAVVDGTPIFSEEVIWEPRKQSDPEYHYREIMTALKTAAARLPRLDAIGGSSAGIYINNRPMVASLFRGIPASRFGEIRDLFLRIQNELQVPLEVINDGDVTALAGSMALDDNAVLGIALGSSEASGYVNPEGRIMGWLNELAFAPVDYNPGAPIEEWSGDRGCGASYFSQQCVFRLAPAAGIAIPAQVTDAEKLKFVQEKLEAGHAGAASIWQTMGIYLGYGIAHYADFYNVKHVLILGRCTSGRGGELLLEGAHKVFATEFPHLLTKIALHLPDEKVRRVGQSVAAAGLPARLQEQDQQKG
jgi:predicted NBD/HSP70 family sugar kinase